MEGHALAQSEPPDVRLDLFPPGGELRGAREILVAGDQRLVDHGEDRDRGLHVLRVRIHRPRIGLRADAQGLRIRRAGERDRREEGRGRDAPGETTD